MFDFLMPELIVFYILDTINSFKEIWDNKEHTVIWTEDSGFSNGEKRKNIVISLLGHDAVPIQEL